MRQQQSANGDHENVTSRGVLKMENKNECELNGVGVEFRFREGERYRGEGIPLLGTTYRRIANGYCFYHLDEGTLDSASPVLWAIATNPKYAPAYCKDNRGVQS